MQIKRVCYDNIKKAQVILKYGTIIRTSVYEFFGRNNYQRQKNYVVFTNNLIKIARLVS